MQRITSINYYNSILHLHLLNYLISNGQFDFETSKPNIKHGMERVLRFWKT